MSCATSTRGIVNKGEDRFPRLSPVLRFTHGGYECTPLSLTNHTAKRYAQLHKILEIY